MLVLKCVLEPDSWPQKRGNCRKKEWLQFDFVGLHFPNHGGRERYLFRDWAELWILERSYDVIISDFGACLTSASD
jgi:hypothetical protein